MNPTPQQEATDPTTSPERLRVLATEYPKNENILKSIASNPNTPKDLLFKLGERFPQEILDNPIFELLFLENPNLFAEIPSNTCLKLAQNAKIPPHLLEILARDRDGLVRSGVTSNPKIPPHLLEILARDGDTEVRRRVAENPNTPPHLLEILARDGDTEVRRRVAENAKTPPHLLEILARDGDTEVRRRVAENPNTPPHVLEILLRRGRNGFAIG